MRSIIINRRHVSSGFTLVEILLVAAIVAILAALTVVSYIGVQHRSADSVTRSTVADALKTLQLYYVFNKNYPANIADTEYAPPQSVAVVLYTDASQTPVYPIANEDQNAQLFINTCSGLTAKSTDINYTGCVYAGQNVHVSGTASANVVLHGPTIQQSGVDLQCASTVAPSSCSSIQSAIISTFLAQGGHFPVQVPKKSSTLPAPTLATTGTATTFCVQGASGAYVDIMYHALPTSSAPEAGPCPDGLGLHYP